MLRRLIHIAIAIALTVEGLSTGLWVANLLPTFTVYDWLAIAAIVLRALIGAFQFASGWALLRQLPPGVRFAETAFIASAVLTTVEIGLGVSPSSLFPSFRWPVVAAYWLYALVCVGLLRWQREP